MTKFFKAQSSLEYLLVLAALVSFFALAVHSFKLVYFTGLFALDVYNANYFLLELEKKTSMLSVLGTGSAFFAKTSFFNSSSLSSNSSGVFLEISSKFPAKSKTVSFAPASVVLVQVPLSTNELDLLLLKNEEVILVKNRES